MSDFQAKRDAAAEAPVIGFPGPDQCDADMREAFKAGADWARAEAEEEIERLMTDRKFMIRRSNDVHKQAKKLKSALEFTFEHAREHCDGECIRECTGEALREFAAWEKENK